MFVFLSKLLPVFFYPLGLAIILLLAALLLRRSRRAQRICIITALVILFLASNTWVASVLVRSLEWRYLPQETYPPSDVIVVLGGSTASAVYPRQIVEISGSGDRLLYAARLYHQGVAPYLLLSGGYIAWLEDRQAPAEDMAEILQMLAVPQEALWLETQSRNTYENALYTRQILAEKGINRIVLVTSALHMPRAVALFEAQDFEVIPAPADYNITEADWERLWEPSLLTQLFNLLPTASNLQDTTIILKEYFGLWTYRLQGWF